jgi:hypothetical protein
MIERFVKLIQEYQAAVLEAASLFEKYKGVTQNNLSRARFEGLPNDGFLDPEQTIEYYFHGVGCCVTYPNKMVDWDFGNNGRLDGFDAWRLWVFAKEGTNNFPEFKQQEAINKAFREAEIQGIIYKQNWVNKDNLYYLSSAQ